MSQTHLFTLSEFFIYLFTLSNFSKFFLYLGSMKGKSNCLEHTNHCLGTVCVTFYLYSQLVFFAGVLRGRVA